MNHKNPAFVPRSPWGDFPDVVRIADLGSLKKEPEYWAAKAGNAVAALNLADRMVHPEFIEAVRIMVGNHPHPALLPVLAEESGGNNKIPLMLAHVLAHRLGWIVEENIGQISRAFHTDSGADHRLVVHSEFSGTVDPRAGYVLVDDTLTMGGTIAGLRGFVLAERGQVLGAVVAVAHDGALRLPIRPEMVDTIYRKHGIEATKEFAREQWGYGIECLTQGEAEHLRKALSLDGLRDRFSVARDAHGRRLGESRTCSSLSKIPNSKKS